MLPPASAARSTTTEPAFIDSIISLEISFGAGFPGMSAVVIIMSTSRACMRYGERERAGESERAHAHTQKESERDGERERETVSERASE